MELKEAQRNENAAQVRMRLCKRFEAGKDKQRNVANGT